MEVAGLILGALALVVSVKALVISLISWYRSEKADAKVTRALYGPSNGPTIEIEWGTPDQRGVLPCRVSRTFGFPVSDVVVQIRKQTQKIGDFVGEEGRQPRTVEFQAVAEGEKYRVSFKDPLTGRRIRWSDIVRYGSSEMVGG